MMRKAFIAASIALAVGILAVGSVTYHSPRFRIVNFAPDTRVVIIAYDARVDAALVRGSAGAYITDEMTEAELPDARARRNVWRTWDNYITLFRWAVTGRPYGSGPLKHREFGRTRATIQAPFPGQRSAAVVPGAIELERIALNSTPATVPAAVVHSCTRASVALWLPALLFAAYPTIAFIRGPLRQDRRRRKGLCVECGYNLTGNTSGRCPECGLRIDEA